MNNTKQCFSVVALVLALFWCSPLLMGQSQRVSDCWTSYGTPAGSPSLRDIYFVDERTGWAVGDSGVILKTTDSGESWSAQNSGVKVLLVSVYFSDTLNGWACGEAGVILKTANGGKTWHKSPSGVTADLKALYFHDALTGWVCGWENTILKTTDGGETWHPQISGAPASTWYNDMFFTDDRTGWLVGLDGRIVKTTDGGATWNLIRELPATLNYVHFVDSLVGWVAGYSSDIYKTTDGGITWKKQNIGEGGKISSIYFANATTGWGSYGQSVYKTTDGGATWLLQFRGVSGPLFFIDDQIGWVLRGYHVSRTTDGGQNWTNPGFYPPATLSAVYFVDTLYGWIVGNGAIFRTRDGGKHWSFQSSPYQLNKVYFTDTLRGCVAGMDWAVDRKGVILCTTDGGQTWEKANIMWGGNDYYKEEFKDLFFVNTQVGWAHNRHSLYKTEDGGKHWKSIKVPSYPIISAHFLDSLLGWLVAYEGSGTHSRELFRTTDGGKMWTRLSEPYLFYVTRFARPQLGIGGGIDLDGLNSILKTNDGGVTWTVKLRDIDGSEVSSMHLVDTLIGWATSLNVYRGVVLETLDGGETWTRHYLSTPALFGVHAPNAQNVWVVGSRGAVMKYTPVLPACIDSFPLHGQGGVDATTELHWPEASGCPDGYRIILSTTPGGNDLLDTLLRGGNPTHYSLTQPLPVGRVYVRLIPFNELGFAEGCSEFWFQTVSSVRESRLAGVQVGPNPVRDQLNIRFERPLQPEARLRLSSLNGQVLLEQKFTSADMHLHTAHLPAGVYLLQLTESGQTGTWRVIKAE